RDGMRRPAFDAVPDNGLQKTLKKGGWPDERESQQQLSFHGWIGSVGQEKLLCGFGRARGSVRGRKDSDDSKSAVARVRKQRTDANCAGSGDAFGLGEPATREAGA